MPRGESEMSRSVALARACRWRCAPEAWLQVLQVFVSSVGMADGKRAAEALVDLTQDSDDDAQLLPAAAKKMGAAAPARPPRKTGVVVGSGTPMLASLLARVLACGCAADATALLASKACRRDQRRAAAVLAGLEIAWVQCDQSVPENVDDLARQVVAELYEPFW